MMTRCAALLVFLCACHASCDESTGAAPVVVPEGGAAIGSPQNPIPNQRSMMMRPMVQPAASLSD